MAGVLRHFLRPSKRLRFTREGKYFVALTLGIGFAAINTGNNLLYLLLGMMLALIIGSGVLSELSLRELRVGRLPPDRIFALSPFLMGVTLENPKRRMSSYSIEVEDVLQGENLEKRCYFLKIPPGRTQTTSYRHTFSRRGIYRFSAMRINTRFPFTFFRKTREVHLPGEAVVFPRVFAVTPPGSEAQAQSEQQNYRLDRRGDFFALREYQAGDDPRDVHWRKSAGLGRMMVRQHEDQRGRQVTLYLDNHQPAELPDEAQEAQQEQAVSLAASLALYYIQRGFSLALVFRGGGVSAGVGQAHLTRVLRALALVAFSSEKQPFGLAPGRAGDCVFVTLSGCSLGRPSGMAA